MFIRCAPPVRQDPAPTCMQHPGWRSFCSPPVALWSPGPLRYPGDPQLCASSPLWNRLSPKGSGWLTPFSFQIFMQKSYSNYVAIKRPKSCCLWQWGWTRGHLFSAISHTHRKMSVSWLTCGRLRCWPHRSGEQHGGFQKSGRKEGKGDRRDWSVGPKGLSECRSEP